MAVSKRTRFEVLRRDNFTCRYCRSTESALTVDHVTPVALGGDDSPGNLVAACRDCNAGKSSSSPDAIMVEDVSEKAIRWARAMEVAADRLAERDAPRRAYIEYLEDAVLSVMGHEDLPLDWRDSLDQFYRAGITRDMVEESVNLAVIKGHIPWRNKWRYACGVAWIKLRELQAEAVAILDESEV